MTEEKIYQDIRNDFENKYINYVVPKISPYDEERKKTLKKTTITVIIMLIIGIISLCLATKWNFMKFGGAFILFALAVYPISKKRFEYELKKLVMPVVCGCFPNLKWLENNDEVQNEADIYINSGLLSYFNNHSFDDCFSGKYNDVGFEIREFSATKETGFGKDKKTVTVFDGVIVTLEMNKNFTGNTVVRPHGSMTTHSMSIKWQKTLGEDKGKVSVSKSPNLHKTTLEDVEFNKKFEVYTDDEVEARYLLTTSLMERLKTMQTSFSASSTACAFYDKKFYVALYTKKDLFAIGALNKNVCDKEQFDIMFEEILSIIKLIDHFKLDQKIGI